MNDKVLEAAVEWRVRQESGRFDDRARHAFHSWLQADARHRQAWEHMGSQALAAPLATLRALHERGTAGEGASAADVLEQTLFKARRRRTLRGALAIGGMASAAGLVAQRQQLLGEIGAEVRTGTAERRVFAWAEGTNALLDARSAADTERTDAGRQFHLRTGALQATPAAGLTVAVHTPYGMTEAGIGRIDCRLQGNALQAIALDHDVVLRSPTGQVARLRAGEGAHLSVRGIDRMAGNALARTAWQGGMLSAEDWALGEVIDAVRAYTPGFIQVSAAATRLRVFGIFRLSANEVLEGLAYLLPLKIVRVGPWLTRIDVAAPR